MENIRQHIEQHLLHTLNNIYPNNDFTYVKVKSIGGIYFFNSFYQIAQNTSKTQDEVINDILTNFICNGFCVSFQQKKIIFSMDDKYLSDCLTNTLLNGIIKKTDAAKKILVDFSSPNIAKDMHVGHLRSTIIGDSISTLYELLGHNVYRINHIGDYGTQFGTVIQYLYEKHPDFEKNPPNIQNLQTFYSEAKIKADEDIEFKQRAYEKALLLQKNDPSIISAWKLICKISKDSRDEIYQKLNVKLDEFGESYYKDMLKPTIQELEKKNILSDVDGRKVAYVNGHNLPLIVMKSNGGYTYDTTDLAAIRYRLVDLEMDEVYYVVDSSQSEHFDLVFATAQAAGWYDKKKHKVEHIGFGLVLGYDGKRYKSRDGNTIPLMELLNEGINRAEESIRKRETNMTEEEINNAINAIAYGGIKYTDLAGKRTNNYTFSFDKMLKLDGNTIMYQMYSHIRLQSIMRKVDEHNLFDQSNFTGFKFTHNLERELAFKVLTFPEIIDDTIDDKMLHRICLYLYELSDQTQKFCTTCRCINFDNNVPVSVNETRIMLCKIVIMIQEVIFKILNISTISKI